jgi:hypothetical protein
MEQERQEAMFYLQNPDKLVFSEDPAAWYLMGVHWMYGAGSEHHINYQFIQGEQVRDLLKQYSTIWRYQDGAFVRDEELYRTLQEKNGLIQ